MNSNPQTPLSSEVMPAAIPAKLQPAECMKLCRAAPDCGGLTLTLQVSCYWRRAGHVTDILVSDWFRGTRPSAGWPRSPLSRRNSWRQTQTACPSN